MNSAAFYKTSPAVSVFAKGGDAFQFLQSQFSNDLPAANPGSVTYGLWLDRRGKVAADSFVLQEDPDQFLIHSYFCPASEIIRKLDENIIADDVELIDQSSGFTAFSCWGLNNLEPLAFAGLDEPETGSFKEQGGLFWWEGRRSRSRAFDFLAQGETAGDLEGKIERFIVASGGRWVSEAEMHVERIVSGIPWIPVEIGPNDLPQEGGLEEDAVSFSKGCYLGQEVMARIFSRGNVKRGLYRVAVDAWDDELDIPCELYQEEAPVGQLRSIVQAGGETFGHALLRYGAVENQASFSLRPAGESVVRILGPRLGPTS